MRVYITKISPATGKVEGGEYILIQGNGFNSKDIICKFGNIPATTFRSDSNTLFCQTPPSENLEVDSVLISLWLNNELLTPDNLIKFEYIISKEKKYLLSFIVKLDKLYSMQFMASTKMKIQELIDHSQNIIDNLEKLQSDSTLNERLTTLKLEFQVLLDDISSQLNSKVPEENSIVRDKNSIVLDKSLIIYIIQEVSLLKIF